MFTTAEQKNIPINQIFTIFAFYRKATIRIKHIMYFFTLKGKNSFLLPTVFIALFLVISTNFAAAQDWTYPVTGKVKKAGKTLEGAVVTLFKNGSQVQQIVTSKNGKFDFVLEPDNEYILQVTKPGHIVKKIIFDMRNVPPERGKYGFAAFIIEEIVIFEYPQGVDKSEVDALTVQPLALVKYDPKQENFDYDRLYSKQRKKEIDKINDLQKKVEENPVTNVNNNGQIQLENQYNLLIQEGDALFKGNNFDGAKGKYEDALKLKPEQQYPKDQIKLCADKLKLQQIDKQYTDLIKTADEEFKNKSYQTARNAYYQASQLKPNEQYPKDKMAECDKLSAEQKELETKYKQFIDNGNSSYNSKMYNIALTNYKEASKLKPNENYPKEKIKELEKLIGEQEKEQKYKDAVKKGDDAFAKKEWVTAKAGYTEATGLKPDEQYPKTKLQEIEKILADEKLKQEQEQKFKDLITQADKQFGAKDYINAKSTYNKALEIKSGEQYPKEQIAKIDKILADADKQKEIDLKYNSMMEEANSQFAKGDYQNAKSKYQEASNLKPLEKLPKDKIIECDKKLNEKLKQEELDKKYNDAITKGDDAFGKQDWITAKTAYTTASGLKPTEQYPKDKLLEIEKKIKEGNTEKLYNDAIAKADKLFGEKNYAAAKTTYQSALSIKPNEKYPQDKIAECDKLIKELADKNAQLELDKKYAAALKKGDDAFALKNWAAAKSGYTEASGIKPSEQYPKDKLAEIEKLLGDEKNKLELEKKYKDLITQADKQFTAKDYTNAKATYNEALAIKSGEQYPKDQIAKIDALLSDVNKQKELDTKYLQLMQDADKLFASKDYVNAKTKYQGALSLKPNEKLPKDKIAECDKLIALNDKNADLQKKYDDAIKNADANFSSTEYITAKQFYTEALTWKPTEKYPKDKLAEIEKILADKKNADALNQKYNDAIAKADKLFADKDYKNAKTAYQSASAIKPTEQYPKDKIAECDKILNDTANDKVNAQKYADAIKQADKLLTAKDYINAKAKYQEASGYKPSEQYPKDKINEIDAILKKMEDEKNAKLKEKELNDKYVALITKGDVSFAKKEYYVARDAFTEALNLMPTQVYPKTRLDEINKIIKKLEEQDATLKAYNDNIVKGDIAFNEKRYADAQGFYTTALGLKPTEKYPQDKLNEIKMILQTQQNNQQQSELLKEYAKYIKLADEQFQQKNYEKAKINYKLALTKQPNEQYPKDRLAKIEQLLNNKPNSDTTKVIVKINPDDPTERERRYKEYLAKYGKGITEKPETQEQNKKVLTVYVVTASEGDEYKRVTSNYGAIFYYKNGVQIPQSEFADATLIQ